MKKFENFIILGMACFFLASCATAPPNLSDVPSTTINVPAKKVVVSDFMREQKYNAFDAVWSGSFNRLPSNSTIPSFPELVLSNLQVRLKGSDEFTENVEISVLDSNLLMESHVADSVAFVGIASAFSARQYMCVADINIRYKDRVVRKKFDATLTKSRSWGDIPTSEKSEMISVCLSKIVEDVALFATNVIKN